MATKIETLKKPNGDQVLPRTHAKAVSMENGMTVDVAIEDITEQLKTCPDANSVVLHTQQELTETQKSQARTNIGITEWLTSEDVEADSPTPIDADTLGGHSVNYFTSLIDKLDARINYLEAICSDNMVYYSTLNKAVTDVNNGTLANADANKNTAVAGVYTDKDGGKNVVLLKDTTEAATVSPAVDMTINLGGHKLTTTAATAIDLIAGNLAIDGRLEGSGIENASSGVAAKLVQTAANTNLVVTGGSYSASTDGKGNQTFMIGGKANISNAVIDTQETTRGNMCVYVTATGEGKFSNCAMTLATGNHNRTSACISNDGPVSLVNCDILATAENATTCGVFNYMGTATITNCDIEVSATGDTGKAFGITNAATTTVTNCDIRAYSNYHKNGDGYSANSQGVQNASNGTLTINDCYVFGTHSGMQNNGTLYINGGTYEAYGHGGIYFAGAGTTSYVRNATLKDCLTMPEVYEGTSQHNGAGFYIGGGVGQDNIKVYMDNCKIYGSASQIVLRGSSGEQNNTLKISNSNLYDLDGDYLSVRIDNDTHKLYIGKGCNFTAENTTLPSAVIATDEVYVQAA